VCGEYITNYISIIYYMNAIKKLRNDYTVLQGSVTQTARRDSCRFFDVETESDIRIAPSRQNSE